MSADRPSGPYHWSTHRILDADLTGSRYGGRLVPHRTGWQLLTWLGTGPDGRFRGEIADPVPILAAADGGLAVDRSRTAAGRISGAGH